MFFPKHPVPQPDPRQLEALRLSLNTAVLTAEDLPAGPARAVIAVLREGDGGARVLEVCLRSSAGDEMVAYGFDGPLDTPQEVDTAVDAALTFAEGMGFVFDDDLLEQQDGSGRAEAIQRWRAFLGLPEIGGPAQPAPARMPGELLLGADREEGKPARRSLSLSKSRGRAAEGALESAARSARKKAQAAALGRVRLVKRRRHGSDETLAQLLARLLGAF